MRIEIENLCFSAGRERILDGVSAVFEGKRVYGVIGQNGSGKTTLLRHLYRACPARGHIRIACTVPEDRITEALKRLSTMRF